MVADKFEMYDLGDMSAEKLKVYAKKLSIDLPPKAKRETIEDMVQKALYKKQLRLEQEARLEFQAETAAKLGRKGKRKPSPEVMCIAKSRKVHVMFYNRENPGSDEEPGADIEFNIGGVKGGYTFHLFDSFKHVMPECLVTKDKNYPLPEEVKAMFPNFTIHNLSLALRCVRPVYGQRKTKAGHVISVKISEKDRFLFSILGPAPNDAPFGVVFDEVSEPAPELVNT